MNSKDKRVFLEFTEVHQLSLAASCHSVATRFKPCKIRVKMQTTSGKKICRSITVKSTSHKLSEKLKHIFRVHLRVKFLI